MSILFNNELEVARAKKMAEDLKKSQRKETVEVDHLALLQKELHDKMMAKRKEDLEHAITLRRNKEKHSQFWCKSLFSRLIQLNSCLAFKLFHNFLMQINSLLIS